MQPTPRLRRAALRRRYIWPCSPPVRTPAASPTPVVGSYPAFSPLPDPDQVRAKPAVVFCYALHELSPICAFHREALCAVRTFLTARRRRDRKACRLQRYKKNGLSRFFSIFSIPAWKEEGWQGTRCRSISYSAPFRLSPKRRDKNGTRIRFIKSKSRLSGCPAQITSASFNYKVNN